VRAEQLADLLALAGQEGVLVTRLGEVGGQAIRIAIDGMPAIEVAVDEAARWWSTAIGAHFEPESADVR
jgi:hypothetical protein